MGGFLELNDSKYTKIESIFWFDFDYFTHILFQLSLQWEWGVYFLTTLVYEKSLLILVYPLRIQSDHSESDRSDTEKNPASVPITEKDPRKGSFSLGDLFPSSYIFVFRRQKKYIPLLKKIKLIWINTKTLYFGSCMHWLGIMHQYNMRAPCSSRRSKEFYS